MKRLVTMLLLAVSLLAARPFDISPQQFVDRLQRYFKQCGLSHSIKLDKSQPGRYILTLDDYAKFRILYKTPEKVDSVYVEYSGKLGSMIPTMRIANQTIPFIGALSGQSCKHLQDWLKYLSKINDTIKGTLKDDKHPMAQLRTDGLLIDFTKVGDHWYEVSFMREGK
jgi:hypothetical protein